MGEGALMIVWPLVLAACVVAFMGGFILSDLVAGHVARAKIAEVDRLKAALAEAERDARVEHAAACIEARRADEMQEQLHRMDRAKYAHPKLGHRCDEACRVHERDPEPST